MTTDSPQRSSFTTFLVIACVALLALNIALVVRNRTLMRDVHTWKQVAEASARSSLQEGESIAELPLRDESGGEVLLSFGQGQGGAILFISSLSCLFCADMEPLWNEAALRAEESGIRAIGIVLDGTPDSLQNSNHTYPKFLPTPQTGAFFSRIPAVPATIVVDENGVIQHVLFNATVDNMVSALDKTE